MSAKHTPPLTPGERAFLEVLRRRDPARPWRIVRGRRAKKKSTSARDERQSVADKLDATLEARALRVAAERG
jgi:hypothetical protein